MLRISTPMKLPKIVPRPPNRATPPMITAAITCSSRLTPALSGARPTRPNSSAAPRPQSPPISTKQTSLTRRGVDAVVARRLEVAAGGIDVAAELGAREHDAADQHDDQHRDENVRDRRAGKVRADDLIERKVGVLRRDRVAARDGVGGAAQQRQHAERGDERRQADAGDEEPVDRADHEPDHDHDAGREPGIDASRSSWNDIRISRKP